MPPAEPNRRDALSFGALVAWAWTETAPVHRHRTNLLIHLVAVPLFVAGHGLLGAAVVGRAGWAVPGLLGIVASLALQKRGHALEQQPSIPFASRRDFVRRIYAEQFINFWRFLLGGQWYASFRASGGAAVPPARGDG